MKYFNHFVRESIKPALAVLACLVGMIGVMFVPGVLMAHGVSVADQQLMATGGYLAYIRLGAVHMVTGYDHLLFLFGVVFFLTSLRQIVQFVTAFTLGHSITLIGATFAGISANYYLVDAVIALTVCYKGFDNLDGFRRYLGMKSPNLLLLVFIFGLIHGFGLSTRLQQLPLGDHGLLLKIISFNVGVELGQVTALVVMVAVLNQWRKRESFGRLSNAINTLLLVIGALLFIMQIHGYQHDVYADDFGLNQDAHHHIHEDWKYEERQRDLEMPDAHGE